MYIFNAFYLLHAYSPSFLTCLCFNMVSFRGQKSLGRAQIGLLQGFNSKFPTSILTSFTCGVTPPPLPPPGKGCRDLRPLIRSRCKGVLKQDNEWKGELQCVTQAKFEGDWSSWSEFTTVFPLQWISLNLYTLFFSIRIYFIRISRLKFAKS